MNRVLLAILVIYSLCSCTAQKRFNRLIDKNPWLMRSDTTNEPGLIVVPPLQFAGFKMIDPKTPGPTLLVISDTSGQIPFETTVEFMPGQNGDHHTLKASTISPGAKIPYTKKTVITTPNEAYRTKPAIEQWKIILVSVAFILWALLILFTLLKKVFI